MPLRKIKIEDLRRFVFVSDPQVSPEREPGRLRPHED
jgi:hypothetical protein